MGRIIPEVGGRFQALSMIGEKIIYLVCRGATAETTENHRFKLAIIIIFPFPLHVVLHCENVDFGRFLLLRQ